MRQSRPENPQDLAVGVPMSVMPSKFKVSNEEKRVRWKKKSVVMKKDN